VKSLAEKTVQITDEKDLEQFLKITVVQEPVMGNIRKGTINMLLAKKFE
jgi:hypothetical protein